MKDVSMLTQKLKALTGDADLNTENVLFYISERAKPSKNIMLLH